MNPFKQPTKNFFILPNNIFDLRLDPIQFSIFAYLISASGQKRFCWPSQNTICDKTSIGITAAQKHLKILERRQLIAIKKSGQGGKHKSDDYYPLSLDNPEVYRDIGAPDIEMLPLEIGEDFPA